MDQSQHNKDDIHSTHIMLPGASVLQPTANSLPDFLLLGLPLGPRDAERASEARICDVAEACDGLVLGDVDAAALVEDVAADVDVLDEPEHHRRRRDAGVGVRDVDRLVELALHAERAFEYARRFDVHLHAQRTRVRGLPDISGVAR